jgi:hypothetical protein
VDEPPPQIATFTHVGEKVVDVKGEDQFSIEQPALKISIRVGLPNRQV